MRIRLALIVLVLVILPTAVLSLAASRALRHWELILEQEREVNAGNVIETAVRRIRTRLEDDLDQVSSAMSDCLRRSAKFQNLDETAERLRQSNDTIKKVFLFASPWGFLYPQDAERGRDDKLRPGWDYVPSENQSSVEYEQLLAALRQKIGTPPQASYGGTTAGTIWLKIDNGIYCFSSLEIRKSLHAGYEIDMDGFMKELSEVIKGVSGSGIRLVMSGSMIPENSKIVISDSLSGQMPTDSLEAFNSAGNWFSNEEPLSERNLFAPFSFIRIAAFTRNPAQIKHAAQVRARLYGWGILLLAGVIVGATWLVLREAGLEIRRARARSDFVMGVSHDLRTPVSSMKMLAESLYLDHVTDTAKKKEFLGTIARECDRLADMIERVLFFMRQENKAIVYSFAEVPAVDFVSTVLQSFQERRKGGKGRELILNYKNRETADKEDGSSFMIRVDKTAISQVIFNLLDNAVKYSPPGSPIDVSVDRITRRWGHSLVRIMVKDEGEGITKREIRRIFRPFYRVNPETRESIGGVGLGLSLCRKVVKKHGGRIEVRSVPGKGSEFFILLPGM